MGSFVAVIVAYPVVVWSVLLGAALLYWVLVMVGALDIDLFSGADGAMDGALDGAADGALDGAADGAVDGGADGAGDGLDTHGTDGHAAVLPLAWMRAVPITVSGSVMIVFGWLLSVAGVRVASHLAGEVPGALVKTGILLASALIALPLAGLCVRPLRRFFATQGAKGRSDLVGRICVVTTGTVTGRFGQASLEGEDMSLLLQVRHDHPDALRRGDQALIVAWDSQREAFVVEPVRALLHEQTTEHL